MHQARGGILFIDEAYGMAGSTHGTSSYAKEAVDTLVGQITTAEFKGNLLVIMAGYEADIDKMFANANPGLQSRFNKKRVKFEPWSVEQAVTVVAKEITDKEGKTITEDAISLLRGFCRQMHPLPSWASARDVFETILPTLYTARASRLRKAAKEKQMLDATGAEAGAKSGASKRKAAQGGSEPYTAADVRQGLEPVVASRMQAAGYENYQAPEPEEGVRSMGGDDAAPRQPPKTNVKHKVKVIDDISEDEDEDEADIFAALEEACVDLGYTEDDIAEMLRPGGDYTDELLDKIRELTGCNDLKKIRAVLDRQKHALLVRVEKIIEQRKQEQTEEEMKIQEKLKKIGRSLSFVFTFVSRCASHLFCVLPRIAPSLCQHLTRFFAQMRMFCCSCLSHFPCSRCEHALLAALCHTTTFCCSSTRALINAFVQQMPDGLRMAQSRGRLAMCGRLTLLHRRASQYSRLRAIERASERERALWRSRYVRHHAPSLQQSRCRGYCFLI